MNVNEDEFLEKLKTLIDEKNQETNSIRFTVDYQMHKNNFESIEDYICKIYFNEYKSIKEAEEDSKDSH